MPVATLIVFTVGGVEPCGIRPRNSRIAISSAVGALAGAAIAGPAGLFAGPQRLAPQCRHTWRDASPKLLPQLEHNGIHGPSGFIKKVYKLDTAAL
jgi:hypothetical protein